jgi:two-component system sensor histidine kinase UhpB
LAHGFAMTSYRILHVEDSPDDSELVRIALRKAPFAFSYLRAETQAEYIAHLEAAPPDVILCDYNLPEFSAERALKIMQERGLSIPFIVISHHIGESAVIAMQKGADDYLPKRNLTRLAKAIESAIEHARARADKTKAQSGLRASESVKRSILDSLGSRVAMIDGEGFIRELNKSWQEFGSTTPGPAQAARLGDNYLDILRASARAGSAVAGSLLEGIEAVVARASPSFSFEYDLAVEGATRWYHARAYPLEGEEPGAVVSHRDVTDRMTSQLALALANKRLHTLSKRVLSVQEEERRRISRDLHDDIGQSLTALKIGLHRLAKDAPSTQAHLLGECIGVADATLDKLRVLALELRPPQLDQLGLADALQWLVERQRNTTGLDIHCNVAELAVRPPAALESACYRIAQEALNNATCHAKATSVFVDLEVDARILKLTIRDDGIGFDEETERPRALAAGSLGLISMEERAQLAGGQMALRSAPGEGTTLSASFPLDVAAQHAKCAQRSRAGT